MKIKLNADVGEGMANDVELMPFLTYANIACGGHTGSLESIKKTIKLAQKREVKVGAHPSYPDKANFGRQSLAINKEGLQQTICEQVDLFLEAATELCATMHHIKLHGALYNDVFKDLRKTNWFLNFVTEKYKEVKIFAPFLVKDFIDEKFNDLVIYEAFADRNYNNQLQLISRSLPNACMENENEALKHVKLLFLQNKLITIEGNEHNVKADTFCLHGDNPNVLAIAQELHQLEKRV